MRVVLVSPHYTFVYEQYAALTKVINFHPPLGLCYLASVLEQNGHEVCVRDAEANGQSVSELVEEVLELKPDLVGISITTPIFGAAVRFATLLKQGGPNLPVIVGGPHITLTGPDTLDGYAVFDYGFSGEGEIHFPEFVDKLDKGDDVNAVPGIISRDALGKPRMLMPNTSSPDLDQMPFPDRSKIDLDRYLWSVPSKGIVKTASIQSSRGCPFKCIFCSEDTLYSKTVRFRSVENILKELDQLHQDTEVEHIVFLDDTITLHRRWAVKLFSGMLERGYRFSFECETTANKVDEELVSLMVDAGLVRVNFGIENGDPEMLKILGKGVTLEEVRAAFKLMKKFKIETRGSCIIGNPYETRKTVMKTLRFVWSLKELDQVYINIATPYPGTAMREMAIKGEGGVRLLDTSWEGLKRYGAGVMEVNDLTISDLIKYQKLGTLMFYLQPRRFIYNLRRSGFKAAWRNGLAFLQTFRKGAPVQAASGI